MRNRSKLLILSALIAPIFITGCQDDPTPPELTYNASPLLKNSAENIITVTYSDLHIASEGLLNAVITLQTTPSSVNLTAARDAWRTAREPWEQSEGFLFGPVATNGIDPSIDSWPVNTVDLNAVLTSGDVLTKTFIDGLEGTLKGFHTIEFLLWGEDGNKSELDFTAREFEYLISLCESLEGETEELFLSWDPSGDNFQANISLAGTNASIYPSQSSAVQELINGVIGIADEVANGKINDPLTTGDVTLEESRFSANSKADFADNIRSIQNIYLGTYNGSTGDGLKAFVAYFDQPLADDIELSIQEAIDAVENIPGTFTEAIISNPEEVENAQQLILHIKTHFENDVMPLLDEL